MRFDIITIFPGMFDSYMNASMIRRGVAKKLIDIRVHDLRKFGVGPHRKIDDRPYGGGPGMVVQVEPIIKTLTGLKAKQKEALIVLFNAGGKQFNAKMAQEFSKKYHRIIMIAGHYEGVDERIMQVIKNLKFKIENLSIGPYVLTGGELPAMIVADAVSRHIPGFLGKAASLEESRFGPGLPTYTRPEVFVYKGKKYRVPKVLLTGDHKKIAEWRQKNV